MAPIICPSCGHPNDFEQPYPIHAGFSNQGFLYNARGNLTLVWSSFDPAYEEIVGPKHPWVLSADEKVLFETALYRAFPDEQWKFTNPARCMKCANSISDPITGSIYYLLYPGSIVTDIGPSQRELKKFLSREDS